MANTYRDVAEKTQDQTAAPPKSAGSRWILNRWVDLALFVATPVLIIPAFYGLGQHMSMEDIALYVLAFGAVGHHLPGMLRAYGDKDLFRRFRVRFILAPIFLIALCVGYAMYDLTAVTLAIFLWGAWHGLMQTYGFVRIYDAKVKSFDQRTQRLDFLMCFMWIITGVLLSPHRTWHIIELYHIQCGGPMPPAMVVQGIQIGASVITGIVTILFFVNHFARWRSGLPVSWIKILLLVTSISFWWYANFAVRSLIVGLALFEVFHDVQYLSIVWVFNRGRVKSGASVGAFTRFVFRRSGALIGIYVGICFAYGSLRLVEREMTHATMRDLLTGLLAASTLLHFYYDGFIWKVREKRTGEALGIKEGQLARQGWHALPGWMIHGAKWALFLVPVILLGATEVKANQSGGTERFLRLQTLVEDYPDNPRVMTEYANALWKGGDEEGALDWYRKALDEGMESPVAVYRMGQYRAGQGDLEGARSAYAEALAMKPDAEKAATINSGLARSYIVEDRLDEAQAAVDRAMSLHRKLAPVHTEQGLIHQRRGNAEAAEASFARAFELDPETREAAVELGRLRLARGDAEGAIEPLRIAAENENTARLHHELGAALTGANRPEEAIIAFQDALAIKGDSYATLVTLAKVYAVVDRHDAAVRQLERAIEVKPNAVAAYVQLGQAREAQGNTAEAIAAYRAALEREPGNAAAKARLEALGEG